LFGDLAYLHAKCLLMDDPPPLFLTDAELEYMTGYKQPAAQIRWLQKWRIRHVVNALGYPRVTRAAVEGTAKAEPERRRTEPNFERLENRRSAVPGSRVSEIARKLRNRMNKP
jgi:Domain of unknown function (DUF4224)